VQLPADSPLKAEAKTIANSSADPVARLEAALKLTQDRVRYVFLGMGDGNINPANVDATWQRRFGDCKAKSALLIALLHEVGIEADPVAVNTRTGDTIGDQLPILGAFDHVIVRARAAGKTFWLDGAGTGSWHRADMALPNYQWGLPLTERGEGLVRMIAEPAGEPQVETEIFIDAKAGLHTDAPFKVRKRLHGDSGAMINAQLSGLAPADREKALRTFWKSQYNFVEIKKVAADYDEPAGVETMSMEGTAEMDWGAYTYTTDGMRIGALTDFSREPGVNVDAPFLLEHPSYRVGTERIELPTVGDFVTHGKDYDVALAGSRYSRHSRIEKRVFTAEASVRSLAPEITALDARAAEKQLNDMWRDALKVEATGYYATDADVAALRTRKITDGPNLLWRGNVFLDRGEYDAAYADFEAALKLDDKNYYALADRGMVHFWRGDRGLAKADFDAVLAKDPKNEVALRGRGVLHRDRQEFPEAIEWFTRSLQSDPESTFALGNRAYSYAMIDDKPKALADAATAIRLQPSYVDMYDLRAWVLGGEDDKGPAIREVQAMLAANPDNIAAQKHAARTYTRLGLTQEAVAAEDRVIARDPVAENYLARESMRDPADIAGRMADIDAALAKQPGFKSAVSRRARVQSEAGDHKAAIEAYTSQLKTAARMPEKRTLWTLRGIEYAKDEQPAASRRDFAAALSDYPDGDSYNEFCRELASTRVNLEEALAACEKAIAVAPKDPEYLDSKGLVLLQLSRFDEAFAAYDAALAAEPKREGSRYGRGLAKKRACKCAAGDADIKAARLSDSGIVRTFAQARLSP
jgi:tetratricopeptide (TPR) repeat protein